MAAVCLSILVRPHLREADLWSSGCVLLNFYIRGY